MNPLAGGLIVDTWIFKEDPSASWNRCRANEDAPGEERPRCNRRDFTATHWSVVALAAENNGSPASERALETLCARYWPAIYAFLRRKNYGPADAEDLTQAFFAHVLERNVLSRADRSKGRFRNFLLGALRRFLADEMRKRWAQKRGVRKVVLALDFKAAEERYLEASDPGVTAEELYDQRWAATLLENAFESLRAEFNDSGQELRFNCLKRFLAEEVDPGDYKTIAAKLGIAPKAVSSAVSRMRERYRQLVRCQLLATVRSPGEIDAEFQRLFH